MVFAWDPVKARQNLGKHGVDFVEAMSAFHDPLSLTVRDPAHSVSEDRFILIGTSTRGRLLIVSHIERAFDELRIISARPASRLERRRYEEDAQGF